MKGVLIEIEGTDGSGKRTQTELLIRRLKKERIPAATFSFPQYGKKSAGLIENYLMGAYGNPATLDPCIASYLYALDRFDASFAIQKLLSQGKTVVLDRYVDSNAGHQGGKIRSSAKRTAFLSWLYTLEYGILRLPKPDVILLLHVPARISYKLILKKPSRAYTRGKKRDGLEANLPHLRATEQAYLWLARRFPKNHVVIECTDASGALLSPEVIHEKIWETVFLTLAKKE